MKFEWDEKKAASNFAKHGVSFAEASEAFDNVLVEKIDDRKDYGEIRRNLLGMTAAGRTVAVTYTLRPKENPTAIRIISARPLYQNERKKFS